MRDVVAENYFKELEQASSQALQANGVVERKIFIGGKPVIMQFAGTGLEEKLMPALRHLINDFVEEPELNLILWDSASTQLALPNLPWEITATTDEIWRYQTENVLAILHPSSNHFFWLDRQKKIAVYWMMDSSQVPIADQGTPLLFFWTAWLSVYEIQLVHAAALSGKNGAALLLGKGGSGKSSTALLCLNSSLQYLADDHCIISASDKPQVFSLYSSGKVDAQARGGFPWLTPAFVGMLDHEKTLFHLYPIFANKIINQKPLIALFSCRISGLKNTTIEKISPIHIMRAMAPSTIFQLNSTINPIHSLHIMAEVAKRVEGYQLNLGTDREQISAALIDILGG